MYGRCETDPFDQAIDVCDSCYGEFCESCLVTTKARKHPICKECALISSGIRPGAKPLLRGSKRTAAERRKGLREAPIEVRSFAYFDDVESAPADGAGTVQAPPEGTDPDLAGAGPTRAAPATAGAASSDPAPTEAEPAGGGPADQRSTSPEPDDDADGDAVPGDPAGPEPVDAGLADTRPMAPVAEADEPSAAQEERRHPFLPDVVLAEREPAEPAPTGMAALAEHAGQPAIPDPIDVVAIDEPPPWSSPGTGGEVASPWPTQPADETAPSSPWPTQPADETAPSTPWPTQPADETDPSTPWPTNEPGADAADAPAPWTPGSATEAAADTRAGLTQAEPAETAPAAPTPTVHKPVTDGFEWVSQMPARGASPPLPSRSAGAASPGHRPEDRGAIATVERAPAGLPRRRPPRRADGDH